jgi:hypothetical protein
MRGMLTLESANSFFLGIRILVLVLVSGLLKFLSLLSGATFEIDLKGEGYYVVSDF